MRIAFRMMVLPLVLAACDAPTGPDPALDAPLRSVGASDGIAASVTGSGIRDLDPDPHRQFIRAFTVSAVKRTDGTVKGQYNLVIGSGSETHLHGDVTCLVVKGGRAWIAGNVTRWPFPDDLKDMSSVAVEIVDSGSPDVPDGLSLLGFWIGDPDAGNAWCEEAQVGDVLPITHGDLTVR